jgi:hypothetical protein
MDENDYSYVFLLTFQGYHYFTGGDVGGAYPYEDLETPIATYLNTYPITGFHCCSYKASHHGSANSTNATFLNCIKPQLTVIPSALRSFNGTQLPGQSTVEALLAASSTIYFTYIYVTSPYSGAISSYNDVYLQLTDPGYGSNIPITVGQRLRSKSSPYQPTALFTTGTFTCTLAHNPPTSSLSTAQVQLTPAKNNVRYSSLSARKSRKYIRLDRKVEAIRRKQQKIMEQ